MVTSLEELVDKHERNVVLKDDVEKAYLLEFLKVMKKMSAAETLAREVHALLNTPLRRMQDSMLRVSSALRAFSAEKERTLWNEGAPEGYLPSSVVICEWEDGTVSEASMHHFSDRVSAWLPNRIPYPEHDAYKTKRVMRWRWSGPDVPLPDASIRIWAWVDAPGELRAFSDHGGDEDWVCLVPKELANDYLPFVESLGICRVSNHFLTDGRKVLIGAHA